MPLTRPVPPGSAVRRRAILVSLALVLANAAAAQEMTAPHVALATGRLDASGRRCRRRRRRRCARAAQCRSRHPLSGHRQKQRSGAAAVRHRRLAQGSRGQSGAEDAAGGRRPFRAGRLCRDALLPGGTGGLRHRLRHPHRGGEGALRHRLCRPGLCAAVRLSLHLRRSAARRCRRRRRSRNWRTSSPASAAPCTNTICARALQRYGVTYVAAIFCRDVRPRRKVLSCNQAARIADRFIRTLRLAGGTPEAVPPAAPAVPARPDKVDAAFTLLSARRR